ncbi:hypothetical protein EV178_000130 [Coemansia sp. RSA 1646]|nr:hypothetical protein EV178_000130 [Coemansia sp. RSA 1646]
MTPHVYFLIDSKVLDNHARVVGMVTRVLVYLASVNDAVTWNYEVADLGAVPARKEPRTQAKRRRVAERKPLARNTLTEFATELRGRERKEKIDGLESVPMLGTLTRRLMCLEADVEWGDPALMRSPTRNPHGSRTWADPTRLNESMTLRSYLFIVGREVPRTLDQVERFVHGVQEDGSLMDTLVAVRDGLVGNGLWESYARKRVGVSWIQMADNGRSLRCTDPVDLLIRTTFECCLEALGGSVISLPMHTDGVLPFSMCLSSTLRTRTYPAWSRKFAREISAVAECFDLADIQFSECGCAKDAWEIELPSGDHLSVGAVSAGDSTHRSLQRLTSARLLRRYSMPELVTLAGAFSDTCIDTLQGNTVVRATAVGTCTREKWHRVVDLVNTDPVYCEMRDGSLGSDSGVVMAHVDVDGRYMAVVPGPGTTALVYSVDELTGRAISDRMRAIQSELHDLEENATAADFTPAWLEDWVCFDDDLSVVPQESCLLDVSFDPAAADTACNPLDTEHCALDSSHLSPQLEKNGQQLIIRSPENSSVQNQEDHPVVCLTLESWYADIYLQTIPEAAPQLGSVVDVILPLMDAQSVSVAQLADCVLLNSAAIEDTFETRDVNDPASIEQSDVARQFAEMRCRALKSIIESSNSETIRRTWQLHECQLQILLHLVCLANMHRQDGDRGSEEEALSERLVECLRDLVDLLCIWASVDGLASTSDGVANDLATAFVGGPDVTRFAGTLAETVEELRIQCGWVPPPPPHPSGTKTADPVEGRRRKGTTPRKISRRMDERSEVIVHQRGPSSKHLSSRRIARHLDELICGSTAVRAGENRNPAHAAHAGHLKLPEHLVRQIKSEVVMTLRPSGLPPAPLASTYSTTTVAGSSGGALFAGRKNVRLGRGKRTVLPDFSIKRSASASANVYSDNGKGMQQSLDNSLLTPRTKRQRMGGGGGGSDSQDGSSPAMLFLSPSQRTASHYIYASDGSNDEDDEESLLLDQSPLLRHAVRRPLGQKQQSHTGQSSPNESHRALEF